MSISQPPLPTPTVQATGLARVIGTTYQNTNSTPLFVSATIQGSATTTFMRAKVEASTPPTAVVGQNLPLPNTERKVLDFIVLPKFYYMVDTNDNSGTVLYWAEWH